MRDFFPRQYPLVKICGKLFHVGEIEAHTDQVPRSLRSALRRLLRPLVRLLIARGVPFPFASNVLRGLYVEVAVEEFPVHGKPQTDSRITLLTGVHRKDVKRLRGSAQRESRAPRSASLGSQLIARWTTLAEYRDENGRPKPLPRLPKDTEASFESLVRSVNTDIRPRVVLDEWLRLGLAQLDEQDQVHLNTDAFVPAKGSEEMAYYLGRNLADHAGAAVSNMLGAGEPLLERSVSYNNLSDAAVDELNTMARQRGMQVLQELNARALQLQQRDSGEPDARHRMSFGVYFFRERQPAEDSEDEQ
jgi:hypothetical protein